MFVATAAKSPVDVRQTSFRTTPAASAQTVSPAPRPSSHTLGGELNDPFADEQAEADEGGQVEPEIARVRERRKRRIRDRLERDRPVDVAERPGEHAQADQQPRGALAVAQPARETRERGGEPDSVVEPVREEVAHRVPAEAGFELDGDQDEQRRRDRQSEQRQAKPDRGKRPRQGALGYRVAHIPRESTAARR